MKENPDQNNIEAYVHTDQNLNLKRYEEILGDINNAEIEDVEYDELYDNNTENQIIEKAQKAVEKLEESIPKIKIINLPPDKEIAYKQKFVPQCKLCKHPLRNQAEAMYARYNFVPYRVVKWFESEGEHFTWECVATHMKNHCIWDKPLIDFQSRIKARQDELVPIKQDRIQWNLDALTSANLDLFSQLETMSGDEGIRTYKAVCDGIKVQAQLMKLQHDTMGAQTQAKSIVESNNRRLVTFLERLLTILNDKQKTEALELIREFQAEEARIQ